MLEKLRNEELSLSKEDDVAGFLGVDINRTNEGTIELKQTGLIDSIITAMGMDDSNPKETPAEGVLPKDPTGDPGSETFNYASIIGMLLYLQGHTRPESSFAVSQCARFTFAPKESHEKDIFKRRI